MGACDLVLVHAPSFNASGLDLDIHIRTTKRYQYSFISSAVIRIGEDTLEVSSWGEYSINGVSQWRDDGDGGSMNLAGFPLVYQQINEKQSKFELVLGNDEKIEISSFKDLVSVTIKHGTTERFGDSVGLMGSFDGKLLARDGVTEMEDMNAFGQEWQVRQDEPMLFVSERVPQHPTQCVLPSPEEASSTGRRLGETMAQGKAEEACAHVSEPQRKEACVFDVMAVGDIDIAKTGDYN